MFPQYSAKHIGSIKYLRKGKDTCWKPTVCYVF